MHYRYWPLEHVIKVTQVSYLNWIFCYISVGESTLIGLYYIYLKYQIDNSVLSLTLIGGS